jgi:hemolysin activation/secretion protein
MYRTDGYILSQVIVPPQDVEAGMVSLQVIEGYIADVTLEGQVRGRSDILRAYGEKIKASRPLLASDLERYLLLAGDLAGVTARGVLTPSPDVPGASSLAIVAEHDFAEAFARIDNRGSRFIGPWLFVFGGSTNSTFGQYEKITLIGATAWEPEELQFAELSIEAPVDYEGTVVRFAISGTGSQPGFTLEEDDIDSDSYVGSLEVTHPFVRTREENVSAGLSFEVREVDTDAVGAKIVEDSLRIIRAFGSWDFVDSGFGEGLQGVNLISGEISQGLPIFDASDDDSPLKSRAEADGDFTKFTGTISRLQGLFVPGLNLFASATGQVASEPLLSSEEFGVGGAQFGRGFDPSEITGDHGYATTLELQYGNAVEDLDFLQSYQVYAFWDYGEVFNDDAPGESDDVITLMSAGGGIRINFIPELSGNFEVAQQLHHKSDSTEARNFDTRFLFGVTGRF